MQMRTGATPRGAGVAPPPLHDFPGFFLFLFHFLLVSSEVSHVYVDDNNIRLPTYLPIYFLLNFCHNFFFRSKKKCIRAPPPPPPPPPRL